MAFEATCLVRCANLTTPPPAPRRPKAHAATVQPGLEPALAEFSQQEAALRLTSLLTDLGWTASCEVHVGGGVRRYQVYRVLVPEEQNAAAERMMTTGWQWGRNQLLATDPASATARHHARRVTLARAAWQAAMLAGGSRRRAGAMRICLADQEMAGILVRGTCLIGVAGELTRRPGCFVVAVSNAAVPLLTTSRLQPAIPVPARAALRGRRPQAAV